MRSSVVAPLIALLVLATFPTGLAAQEVVVGGQLRPRWEFRDSLETGDDAFTSMRARASVSALLEDGVRVFLQIQDVRIWGEETNTLGDFEADNFDLHQGYVEVRARASRADSTLLSARVGRQELIFAEQRLIGAVNWAQQGRSFDGVRLTAELPTVRVDVFANQIADATAGTQENDAIFVGGYGTLAGLGPGSLDLYVLFNRIDAEQETNQTTIGARWFGAHGPYRFRGELNFQTGERAATDVTAFMLGARLGRTFADGAGQVTLWYDYLSGDDDPTDGTLRVFDTLFATNHPLYGFADFFTNIPRDTGGRGLQDFVVKAHYEPLESLRVALDAHSFYLAQSDGLSTGHLGEELDLTATYRLGPYLRLVGGFSYLIVGDAFAEIGRLTEDATWVYTMLDVTF